MFLKTSPFLFLPFDFEHIHSKKQIAVMDSPYIYLFNKKTPVWESLWIKIGKIY